MKKTFKQWLGNNYGFVRGWTTWYFDKDFNEIEYKPQSKITKEFLINHLNYLLNGGWENTRQERKQLKRIIKGVKNDN